MYFVNVLKTVVLLQLVLLNQYTTYATLIVYILSFATSYEIKSCIILENLETDYKIDSFSAIHICLLIYAIMKGGLTDAENCKRII